MLANHILEGTTKEIAREMSIALKNYPEFDGLSITITKEGNYAVRLTNYDNGHSAGMTVIGGKTKFFEEQYK